MDAAAARLHARLDEIPVAAPGAVAKWRLWSICFLVGAVLHRDAATVLPENHPLGPILYRCMLRFPQVWPRSYMSGAGLPWQQHLARRAWGLTWQRRVLAAAGQCGAISIPPIGGSLPPRAG